MIKLLIGILIIACILPLFIKGSDGKPIMTLEDWKPGMPDAVSGLAGGVKEEAAAPAKVYKWQDGQGRWQFSNQPPEIPADAEEVKFSGEINLMDAYTPPPQQQAAATSTPQMPMMTGPLTVSPGQVKEIMEKVNNLQQTVDDRKSSIDAATGRP